MEGISDTLLLPSVQHEEEEGEEEEEIETLDLIRSCFVRCLDRPTRSCFPQSPESRRSDSFPRDPIVLDDSEGESGIDHPVEIGQLEDSDSDSYSRLDSRSYLFEGIALDLFNRSHNRRARGSGGHTSNSLTNSVAGSDSRAFEENVEIQSISQLGLGFSVDPTDGDGDKGEICDAGIGEGCGDEFFVGNAESASESGLSSEICEFDGEGLRISAVFGSDSDSDDGRVVPIDLKSDGGEALDRSGDDLGLLPLCWDCLLLGDGREPAEDFEWEEVDRRTVAEVSEAMNMEIEGAINMAFDAYIDEEQSIQETGNHSVAEGATRNLDWEVLLTVNNVEHLEQNLAQVEETELIVFEPDLEQNPDQVEETELIIFEPDDYIHTAEHEVLFGQFVEVENSFRGSPPAAKYIVENLPSFSLAKEDIENNNALCAVCKDDISLEEQAKQLPCTHHYHADCIIPWLGIRNTCPVCRFELPTDDADYEHWRSQRAGPPVGSHVRYDLEVLPEAR